MMRKNKLRLGSKGQAIVETCVVAFALISISTLTFSWIAFVWQKRIAEFELQQMLLCQTEYSSERLSPCKTITLRNLKTYIPWGQQWQIQIQNQSTRARAKLQFVSLGLWKASFQYDMLDSRFH